MNQPMHAPLGWAEVYREHAGRLTRLAVLLVGRDNAHDLVTDAVWRAMSSSRWSQVEVQGAYLTRTLVNLAEDHRRSNQRRVRREDRFQASSGDSAVTDVERALVVRGALAKLSSAQLAVVYLHYWEDLTLEQVAGQLGVGVGTVRSNLHRAKNRLRTTIPLSEGMRP